MYKRVMLTLDGSDLSAEAIPHALEIARSAGSAVVLLQVIDSVGRIVAQYTPAGFEPGPGRVTAQIAEEAVTAQRATASQHLEAVKRQFEEAGVEDISVEIAEGIPADEVAARSEALGCDLVVMATHGRSGVVRAVLGSVADHVVRHTPHAAVLLVRPQGGD